MLYLLPPKYLLRVYLSYIDKPVRQGLKPKSAIRIITPDHRPQIRFLIEKWCYNFALDLCLFQPSTPEIVLFLFARYVNVMLEERGYTTSLC